MNANTHSLNASKDTTDLNFARLAGLSLKKMAMVMIKIVPSDANCAIRRSGLLREPNLVYRGREQADTTFRVMPDVVVPGDYQSPKAA